MEIIEPVKIEVGNKATVSAAASQLQVDDGFDRHLQSIQESFEKGDDLVDFENIELPNASRRNSRSKHFYLHSKLQNQPLTFSQNHTFSSGGSESTQMEPAREENPYSAQNMLGSFTKLRPLAPISPLIIDQSTSNSPAVRPHSGLQFGELLSKPFSQIAKNSALKP